MFFFLVSGELIASFLSRYANSNQVVFVFHYLFSTFDRGIYTPLDFDSLFFVKFITLLFKVEPDLILESHKVV